MPVNENTMDPEQKASEQALQYADEKKFASKLAESMDLPSTLADAVDESEKKPEPVEEEVTEEEVDAEEAALEPEDEAEAPESKEDEEEVIPKSKVQKRFDEQTRLIKTLQKELAEVKGKQETPKDSDAERLEKMGADELRMLKRQIRVEQIRAGSDEVKLAQLLDLEEKVDATIRTAPQRFQGMQIARFEAAVAETASTYEDFDSVKGEIFKHAKAIYESSPELQGSITGQERAWKFAVDHFSAVQKASEGKSDSTELKRQVNTLKKKISVDMSSKKSVVQQDTTKQQLRKATHGTEADKTNYLRRRLNTDSLVTDDELRSLDTRR